MNKLEYQEILETFTKQLYLTKTLIDISVIKLDAIRQNNTDLLMEVTNKEEQCAREIIQLEKKRDLCIKKIEHRENIKINNISQLVESLSKDKVSNLTLIAEELKYNLEILKERNDINYDTILFILEQIEIANNLIIGERMHDNTYDNTKFKKKSYVDNLNHSYFDSKF